MEHQYVPPRTAVEQVLCTIWARVLGVDEVGIEDDFFEFGGHSLLATQVISQVRLMFGTEIPLRHLFEQPTVAGFAQDLETLHAQQGAGRPALLDTLEELQPDEVRAFLSARAPRQELVEKRS
jgi:acyl carrier protein